MVYLYTSLVEHVTFQFFVEVYYVTEVRTISK